MNFEKFQTIQTIQKKSDEYITVSDVEEISKEEGLGDRTLLYGYNVSKFKWHVYFKYGLIHKVIYSNKNPISHKKFEEVNPKILIPNKRLYPEACDYLFCSLLISMGFELLFTNFNKEKRKKMFYGMVL